MGDYPERPGFVAGSDTSEAAADSHSDKALSKMRFAVWRHIAGSGERGATCDEIEVALGLRHQTASARIRELYLGDRVHDTGRRRLTRSGRPARVYVVLKKAAV